MVNVMIYEESNQPRSRRWLLVVVLPVLYVLSVGPVCWIFHALPTALAERLHPISETIYAPLIEIGDNVPAVQEWLDRYAELL